MKKNRNIFIICFVFFLIIMFLSPISGDDWGNYIEGSQGLRHMIGNAIGMYFDWEGRFVSRLLINLLTYNKLIWNIINTFVIIGILYFTNSVCNFKNKKLILLISVLLVLFMNLYTFSQVIVWVAGNITYLFVIPLLLLYIKFLYQKEEFNHKETAFLIFLNINIPMFVEHMAIILIMLNVIFLIINYINHRKINKKILLFLIISIISFFTMFLSPGNTLRNSVENIEFNQLNVFGKIIYNIPNFILYTYTVNYFLILLVIVGSFYLIKNNIENKYIRIILYVYEFISILFGIQYLLGSFGIVNYNYFNENNIFVIVYYILLTIINFILMIKNSKNIKSDLSLLFYIIGFSANVVMLMSPTWGYRTSVATYLFVGISFMIIIDQYIKESKILNVGLISMNSIGMLFYLVFYVSIHLQYKENLKIINNGIETKAEVIEIISYPSFAPCNINPQNDYHLARFKEYYGIDQDVEIKIVDNNWKLLIIYN